MSSFVEGLTASDFGYGGEFALWGVRSVVTGPDRACHLSCGFDQAFAADRAHHERRTGHTRERLALNALKSLMVQLASSACRTITVADSSAKWVTRDELGLLRSLAAAQLGDEWGCKSCLNDLLACGDTQLAYRAAQTFGILCQRAGLHIQPLDPGSSLLKSAANDRIFEFKARAAMGCHF